MTDQGATTPDYTWRAEVTPQSGEPVNITRELAVLYDAVVGSMDWGSGFLDNEDVEAIMRIGQLCGFEGHEYTVEHGNALLLNAEGQVLNVRSQFGGWSGWGDLDITTSGRVLRVSLVNVTQDDMVTAVRVIKSAMQPDTVLAEVTLDNPVEVWASERTSFVVPLP